MRHTFLIYTFILTLLSLAWPAIASETCTQVYTVCVDSAPRDIGYSGGPQVPPSGCWDTKKVYRCVDDDWTNSCPGNMEGDLTATDGYSLTDTEDAVEIFQAHYNGNTYYPNGDFDTGLVIGTTAEYTKFVGWEVECPSSSVLEDICADNPNCNIDALSGYDCVANQNWHVTQGPGNMGVNYNPS